jgi:YVTN family beta-propeller protein
MESLYLIAAPVISLIMAATATTSTPTNLVQWEATITKVPSPKSAAFTPSSNELWVTSLMNKKTGVFIFDTSSTTNPVSLAKLTLPGGGAVEIIFNPDGTLAYASQMETGNVFEIDVTTKKILRTFKSGGQWTKILLISPDGSQLYVSNWLNNDVSVINLATGKLLRKIKTVKTPRGLYINASSTALYVAGYEDGEIQKIDLTSTTTLKSKVLYKTGGAMRHIVADEEKQVLYFSDMGKASIFRLSLRDDTVTKFADTDLNPNTIALSPDKRVLIVSCRGKNANVDNFYTPGPEWGSVLLFDTTTGKMLDALVGGNQPTALAISPDGKHFVFSDFLDAKLRIYSLPDYLTLMLGKGGKSAVYKQELKKLKK